MHGDFKKAILFIALVSFLLLRVGNVHSFSHSSEESDTPHCELCEMLYHVQEQSPVVKSETSKVTITSFFPPEQKSAFTEYEEPLYCFVYPRCIHNKPPPVL